MRQSLRMADLLPADKTPAQRILAIGQGRLIDVVRRALDDVGAHVIHLHEPNDREIRHALCSASASSATFT